MKFVFFGTPSYAANVLIKLNKEFKAKDGTSPVVAVVTQEPKPFGRKKLLKYSSVDTWAHKHNVPIYFDSNKLIEDGINADIGILAAYGEILPEKIINYFRYGILNIHPSLLPKYRGASPVQAAIVSEEKETGGTIIKLDQEMDHGPIIAQFKEEILNNDTTETLRNRLFERSTQVLIEALPAYISGKIKLKPQDDTKATYTKLIKKEHAYIPFEYFKAALEGKEIKDEWIIPFVKNYSLHPTYDSLERFVRAMNPWPIAWTLLRSSSYKGQATLDERVEGLRLQIHSASIEDGKLVPQKVQLEGKSTVDWKQFRDAYKI